MAKAIIPGLMFVAIAVCLVGLGAILLNSAKWREPMNKAENTVASPVTTPPIDAAAPAQTETATFAMG